MNNILSLSNNTIAYYKMALVLKYKDSKNKLE